MTVRRSLELHNTTSGHNKFYRITIEELSGEEAALRKSQQWRRFILRTHWGPIGKTGVSQEKGAFESYQIASRAITPLIRSKVSKGYNTVSDQTSTAITETIAHPMLLVKGTRDKSTAKSDPSPGPSPDLSRFTNIELF